MMLDIKAQKTVDEAICDISRDLMESLKNKEYNIGVYNKSMARVYGIEKSAKDGYKTIRSAIMDNAETLSGDRACGEKGEYEKG